MTHEHEAVVERLSALPVETLARALAAEQDRLLRLRDIAGQWLANEGETEDLMPALAMEVLFI